MGQEDSLDLDAGIAFGHLRISEDVIMVAHRSEIDGVSLHFKGHAVVKIDAPFPDTLSSSDALDVE